MTRSTSFLRSSDRLSQKSKVLLSPSDAGVLSHNGTETIGWMSNLRTILYSSMGTPIMVLDLKETLISIMKTPKLLQIAGEVTSTMRL